MRIYDIKRRAIAKGKVFNLTDDELKALITGVCHYCKTTDGIGVDRKDHLRDYDSSNCVSACWPCNCLKMTMTEEQFFAAALNGKLNASLLGIAIRQGHITHEEIGEKFEAIKKVALERIK